MGLQLAQIKEKLKSPAKRQIVQKAIKHENRIRFHSESYLEPSEISQPLTVFLEWVKSLIPKDKYNVFVSLFKFPTPVIELTSRIFSELERVFDGRNPAINFQFNDSTLRDDWEWYRQEKLKEPEVWREKAFSKMKAAINSVLIVDLPKDQTTERPEPYFYFLGIENVLDFEETDNGLNFIMFKQSDENVAFFDDEKYWLFRTDGAGEVKEILAENPHDLGYCPATFFWREPLTEKFPEIKKSPISKQLSNMDWLLFYAISKRHLDMYASYPIYSAYEADCTFRNEATGDYCDGGFLRNIKGDYRVYRDGSVERCPVCSEKRLAGPGSFLEVPIPQEGSPDLKNPVQITTIDRESLDYNVEEVERLKEGIFASVVGIGGDVQQKEAINKLQVTANFEDKSSVLNNLKGNFEKAMRFVDDTCCRLRYGDQFLSSTHSLGTEFYIYSLDDLYNQYKQAKDNGASDAQLDVIADQIIETENRNNPVQLQRMIILKHLEPYRHYTFNDLVSLKDTGLIDPELMRIKINFNSFVERFERENTNIIEFASLKSFDQKIKIITEKFKQYGKEQQQQQQQAS